MSEKKVVNRTVTIALGLVCIVLAAGLIVVLANGNTTASSDDQQTIADLQTQLTNKINTIATLNSQIASLQSQLNNINQNSTDADAYEAEITQLNAQLQYYNSVLHLNESAAMLSNQPLTQNANTSTVIWQDTVNYAGYTKVVVQATSNTTYVQAIYTYGGVNYNQNITVGTSGTAYFPVLPSTLELLVGNTEPTEDNNATITATYYY